MCTQLKCVSLSIKDQAELLKHLKSDMVVTGNLNDIIDNNQQNFIVGGKKLFCQNCKPYQRIDLWCGTELFPIRATKTKSV
jgi:hypothetical protein